MLKSSLTYRGRSYRKDTRNKIPGMGLESLLELHRQHLGRLISGANTSGCLCCHAESREVMLHRAAWLAPSCPAVSLPMDDIPPGAEVGAHRAGSAAGL